MLIESLRIVLKLVVVSVDKDKQLVVAVEAIHEDPQITQLLLKVGMGLKMNKKNRRKTRIIFSMKKWENS